MPQDEYVGGSRIPPGSKPARHTSPAARQGTDLVTLGEVEERLWECDAALADLVSEHYQVAHDAGKAKADWYGHRDKVIVMLADAPGKVEAQDIREARARRAKVDPRDPESATGDDLYHTYKLHEARKESVESAMWALKSRMSSLQTLARGIQAVS